MQSASTGGWATLPLDVIALLDPLLPVRERFGVLPRLNRHWHAESRCLPIDAGLYELAAPCRAASAAAIRRRGRELLAWLGAAAARGQRLRLHYDLPDSLSMMLAGTWGKRADLIYDAQPLSEATLPTVQAMVAAYRGSLVSFALYLGPPPGYGAPGSISAALLEGCTSLQKLSIRGFRGAATELASLLAAAPDLAEVALELRVPPPSQRLQQLTDICGQPAAASLLASLNLQTSWAFSHVPDEWPPAGLVDCTALTALTLPLGSRGAPAAQLPAAITRLTRLARLEDLRFDGCTMPALPAIVSSFSHLTCLFLAHCRRDLNTRLPSLPAWLAALTGLVRLETAGSLPWKTSPPPACLDALACLQHLEMDCDIGLVLHEASYLSRLTALHWGTDVLPRTGPYVLDVSALAGATCLRKLTIWFDPSEPCPLRGGEALSALSCLTSLSLFGVEAEELPPPGVYISSLQALALDSCKARRLAPALSSAAGLTKLSVRYSDGLHLDQIWMQLQQLAPAWPLLKELEATELLEDDVSALKLLTGELLIDLGCASEDASDAGGAGEGEA